MTPCVEYGGRLTAMGYGRLDVMRHGRRKQVYAHRLMYEFVHGRVPPGMHVCHACDNPPCCNPGHLFLGSNADNVADKMAKGRQPRGERHWQSKLTELTVSVAREMLSVGSSTAEVGAVLGVSRQTICDVKMGRTWRTVK